MQRREPFVTLITICLIGACLPAPGDAAHSQEAGANPSAAPVTVALGGEVILRLRTTAGGASPQQRVDALMQRVDRIASIPDIRPTDVVVYAPPNKPPVIYALGRGLMTVNVAEAQAAGVPPLTLATRWAKKFQQVLPRIDWRRPNEKEPVIPANPPLTVTTKLAAVGGGIGSVFLHDHAVITLYGPQPGGLTAAELTDILTARLNRVAFKAAEIGTDPVSIAAGTGGMDVLVYGTRIVTATAKQAAIAALPSPTALANYWAGNIRKVLGVALPPVPTAPVAPTLTPSSPDAPSVPSISPAPSTPSVPSTPPAPTTPPALLAAYPQPPSEAGRGEAGD